MNMHGSGTRAEKRPRAPWKSRARAVPPIHSGKGDNPQAHTRVPERPRHPLAGPFARRLAAHPTGFHAPAQPSDRNSSPAFNCTVICRACDAKRLSRISPEREVRSQ